MISSPKTPGPNRSWCVSPAPRPSPQLSSVKKFSIKVKLGTQFINSQPQMMELLEKFMRNVEKEFINLLLLLPGCRDIEPRNYFNKSKNQKWYCNYYYNTKISILTRYGMLRSRMLKNIKYWIIIFIIITITAITLTKRKSF